MTREAADAIRALMTLFADPRPTGMDPLELYRQQQNVGQLGVEAIGDTISPASLFLPNGPIRSRAYEPGQGEPAVGRFAVEGFRDTGNAGAMARLAALLGAQGAVPDARPFNPAAGGANMDTLMYGKSNRYPR